MIFLTVIARLADGLLLAASIQEDEKLERDLQHYQSQAKQLLRKLNAQSPDRCMLEAGNMNFCYFISQGVCCLCLCDASFPKKMAFGYLEDLHNEFCEQYGKRIPTVTRPYSFIEFDTYIKKTKKSYVDNKALRILSSVNTELEEVQRIMVANIEDVLQRKPISALDNKANKLSSYAKEYRNSSSPPSAIHSTYTKVVVVVLVLVTLIIFKKIQDRPTSPF